MAGMRLRLRCSKAFSLGDLQWCMVHVPDHIRTVRELAAHVSRLLELNLRGGGGELPQLLLDGFLVPHGEEVREVLRDDEVVDVEPAVAANGLGPLALLAAPTGAPEDHPAAPSAGKRQAAQPGGGAAGPRGAVDGPSAKRAKGADGALMALGWQPSEGARPPATPAGGAAEAAAGKAGAADGGGAGDGGASAAGPGRGGAGIFAGGLPPACDDAALRRHFERFGVVEEATVVIGNNGNSKCFGFVEFADVKSQEAALANDEQEIAGKSIQVKPRKPKGGKDGCKGGKDKGGKGGKKGKDGKGGKADKGGKKGKEGPKRVTLQEESSDGDEDEDEEEEAPPKKAPTAAPASRAKDARPKAVVSQEELELQKQMAAMGLPVSFTASNDRGEGEDDDDEDEEEEEDD